MKALIMAGGFAKRLEPLTKTKSKNMLPVASKPVIAYSIDKILEIGLKDIAICTNKIFYEEIKNYTDKMYNNVNFTYVIEGSEDNNQKLGAVRAMDYAVKKSGINEECIVMLGDNIINFDTKKFAEFHVKNKSEATVALYNLGDLEKAKLYGIAEINNKKEIIHFIEKPKEPPSTLASTGCYFLNKRVITELLPKFINDVKKADNLGDFFTYLLGKCRLYGFEFSEEWYDIGTPKTYLEANKGVMNELKNKKIKKIGENFLNRGVLVGEGIIIGDNTKIGENTKLLAPVVIGKNVEIGNDCLITPYSMILDNVNIGNKCTINSSIIFENCEIKEDCELKSSIISSNVKIMENAEIGSCSVIGENAFIAGKCRILSDSKIGIGMKTECNTMISGCVF
ncbi:MAG: NDP-sugar synthase [Candidatus Nanoarchaeia archaeon]|nr:NDP-sugar synthase [Candidatus Nanoarchaeia archaeon]